MRETSHKYVFQAFSFVLKKSMLQQSIKQRLNTYVYVTFLFLIHLQKLQATFFHFQMMGCYVHNFKVEYKGCNITKYGTSEVL